MSKRGMTIAPVERERKAAPVSPDGTLVLSNGSIRRCSENRIG